MNQLELQQDIGQIVINIAFWTSIAFPVVVRFFWDYTQSWWGKNIVILELLIALALLSSVMRIDFGLNFAGSLWFGWVTIASVALIPIVVAQRVVLIWKAQRKGREL